MSFASFGRFFIPHAYCSQYSGALLKSNTQNDKYILENNLLVFVHAL